MNSILKTDDNNNNKYDVPSACENIDPVEIEQSLFAKIHPEGAAISSSSSSSSRGGHNKEQSSSRRAMSEHIYQQEFIEYEQRKKLFSQNNTCTPTPLNGQTVLAMSDLEGRIAPEPDWYRPMRFVCQQCFQLQEGICIPYPLGMAISAKTHRTVWIVTGRFGSPACAIRYGQDRRYTFNREVGGHLSQMLIRAYKMNPLHLLKMPKTVARTLLSAYFQPLSDVDSKEKNMTSTGVEYHKSLSVPLSYPDIRQHHIVSIQASLLIESHNTKDKFDALNVEELNQMFPRFFTKIDGVIPTTIKSKIKTNGKKTKSNNNHNNKNQEDVITANVKKETTTTLDDYLPKCTDSAPS